jgi:hypothetical protein
MESGSVYFNEAGGKPSFIDMLTEAGLQGGTFLPVTEGYY